MIKKERERQSKLILTSTKDSIYRHFIIAFLYMSFLDNYHFYTHLDLQMSKIYAFRIDTL